MIWKKGVLKTGLKSKRRLARLFPWFQRMNAFSFFFWLRWFQAFAAIFRSMNIFLMQMYTTCFPMFLIMKLIGATLSSFSSNLSNHLPNMLLLCIDLFECSFNSVDSLSETWRVRYIVINLHSATLSTFKTSVVVTVGTHHSKCNHARRQECEHSLRFSSHSVAVGPRI